MGIQLIERFSDSDEMRFQRLIGQEDYHEEIASPLVYPKPSDSR